MYPKYYLHTVSIIYIYIEKCYLHKHDSEAHSRRYPPPHMTCILLLIIAQHILEHLEHLEDPGAREGSLV